MTATARLAAAHAVEYVGLPEAQLNLAQAVVHLATAPKSNRSAAGIWQAREDVAKGIGGEVPMHLRDAHYRSATSLGHGVGLELHERPYLGRASDDLVVGDVIAVEPGCYRPGFGGCRLESLVLVTEDGGRVLTDFPYDL